MRHLILELALWILLAFFTGCVAGCLLRKAFGRPVAAAPRPARVTERADAPKPSRKKK